MSEREDLEAAAETFIERAAAPPGELYYTLLFTPPDRRELVGAAFTFRTEVFRAVDDGTSPEVAGTRLAWWGEEVARVSRAAPRHPLTRLLLARAGQPPQALAGLLAEVVGAAQARCLAPLPSAPEALEHRLAHDWGAVCRLVARGLDDEDGRVDGEDWLEPWARGLGLARGFAEVASEDGDWHRIAGWLADAAGRVPARALPAQRPLVVLAAFEARHLRSKGASRSRPGNRRTRLGRGFANLWTAWRAAGAAARGRLPAVLRRLPDTPPRSSKHNP